MKKIFFVFLSLTFPYLSMFSQKNETTVFGTTETENINLKNSPTVLNGTYYIGTGQDYSNLNMAIANLYLNGADGPVEFVLSSTYDFTSDVFPIILVDFPGINATNTLTIRPASDYSTPIDISDSAIFFFYNAHDIILDGSNNGTESRDLVLINNSTTDSTGVVAIDSLSRNITIKNCLMKASGANIMTTGIAAKNSSNLYFTNNRISKAQIGIIAEADSVFIENNEIGSSNLDEYMDFGVYLLGGKDAIIQGNKIFGLIDDDIYNNPNAIHAIAMENLTGDILVMNNFIDSLIHTGTNNVVQAIAVLNCNTSGFLIANNRISNIASDAYSDKVPCAIAIDAPDLTSIQIIYNSIDMPSNDDYGTGGAETYVIAAALAINACSNIYFKNNIISNTLGTRTGSTNFTAGAAIAMYLNNNPFADIDNNVYQVGGDYTIIAMAVNLDGAMDFTTWQAFTGQETNSIYNEPICFVSDDDLHLEACSPAIGRAYYTSAFPTDIESNQRNGNYPTIGAYTYDIVQANNVIQEIPVKEPGAVILSWNTGSGYKEIIFMKKGDYTDNPPLPIDGTTYNANYFFGQGAEIDTTGWFCVYNDVNTYEYGYTYIEAENDTLYTIMVCDYFGSPGNEIYVVDTAFLNPITVYGDNSGDIKEFAQNISVYPNPTSNIVNFDIDENISEVEIYDFSGEKILTINDIKTKSINISSLSKGIYFIKFKTDKNTYYSKILKQK